MYNDAGLISVKVTHAIHELTSSPVVWHLSIQLLTAFRRMTVNGRLSPLLTPQKTGAQGSVNGKYPIKVGLIDQF